MQSFERVLRTIILAAGASSRMGRPKSTLLLGHAGETFVSRIVATMLAAGLPEIIVVTGAHADATKAAWPARDARVRFIENPDWRAGQLSSLLAGLAAPSVVPIEGAVMTLVDIPGVSTDTVKQLMSIWRSKRPPIVRPARPSTSSGQGSDEHGHPVIFDAAIFDDLRRADAQLGAKAVVRAHADRIVNVPIDDPGAYLDIDTPEQYSSMT